MFGLWLFEEKKIVKDSNIKNIIYGINYLRRILVKSLIKL